jgi:hypothetical protein
VLVLELLRAEIAESEAAVIRGKLAIPKKREVSENGLARLRAAGVASQFWPPETAFSTQRRGR